MTGFHLGVEGEEAAADLAGLLELSEGFRLTIAASPHPASLDELRRRMAATAPVSRVEPDRDPLSLLAEGGGHRVLWLEQASFDERQWRGVLAGLNRSRRDLQRSNRFVVLAGPPELQRIVAEAAPDLWSIASMTRTFPEPPKLLGAAGPIRWLHLSDLQFRADERWDRRPDLHAVVARLDSMAGERPVQMILVAGDVAATGTAAEYEQAERFFSALAEKTKLDLRQRCFIVPGNHDVNRARIGPFDRAVLSALRTEDDVNRLLSHPASVSLVAGRLEDFYDFTGRVLGAARRWSADRPWRGDVVELSGLPVGVVQLNSAWACGSDDDTPLVGSLQLQDAIDATPEVFLRVALMHHPLASLAEFDQRALEAMLRPGPWFVATGPVADTASSSEGVVQIGTRHGYRFLLVDLDLQSGTVRVGLETGVPLPAGGKGEVALTLPPGFRISSPEAATAEALTEPRIQSTTARYRAASAAYHGQARFIGFAQGRERPNADVSELFVPLHLTVRNDVGKTRLSTQDLIRRLNERDAEGRAHRLVVLGDPGSGKTTLTRFLAAAFAGAVRLEDITVPDNLLPVRIAFRDYVQQVRRGRDWSLTDYIEQQSAAELAVKLPPGFLERVLREGDAVVLLDGLDEVGAAQERSSMRDRIAAFCDAFPRVPMLLTSRVAGYDEAPLGEAGPAVAERFLHLVLEAFTDEDLEAFVRRWYGIQERRDPVARDRGTADLTGALNAEPRVKELARNPLLATLIAMIHRFEANLPGERAKLYELCVRTLLETWPAARGHRFAEIDEGLQRVYLEELAWSMQCERTLGDETVSIARDALAQRLTSILQARDYLDEPVERVRAHVERWIDDLETGTGVLVEQSAGTFAFFHLSFLEYLAARAMERHLGADETLGAAIARRRKDGVWREVCLLSVGWNADRPGVLDDVFTHLRVDDYGQCAFLLACMREEARFTADQRTAILAAAAVHRLDEPVQGVMNRYVGDIVRHSIRNGRPVREWLDRQLATAEGLDLTGVAALTAFDDSPQVIEVLSQRPDVSSATAALLDLWPANAAAEWAATQVERRSALLWIRQRWATDVLTFRSIGAVRLSPMLAGSATIALNRRGSAIGFHDGQRMVTVPPASAVARHRAPFRSGISDLSVLRGFVASLLARSCMDVLSVPITDDWRWDLRYLNYHLLATWQPAGEDLSLYTDETEMSMPRPVETARRRHGSRDRSALLRCELLAARELARDWPTEELGAYLALRVHHRIVLLSWPDLDEKYFPADLPHESLAAYLALGWTQATTTWDWPGTTRWKRILGGPPPEHWLPRTQWHLCWLVTTPDDPEHVAALDAALDEGDDDGELPEYAASLRQILGRPKPRRAGRRSRKR